jgi:hypothetical protein
MQLRSRTHHQPPADITSFAVGITTQTMTTTATTKPKTAKKPRAIKKIKSQEEKRAELNAYMAKFRAKKKATIKSLQLEIAFLKLHLGELPENKRICKCITAGDKNESPLKCKPKNIYLPPKEQLSSMTKEEVKAWKTAHRMERKRLARQKADREQKELIISLEGDVSRLKEKAVLMGIPVFSSGMGSTLEDAIELGSEYCGVCGLVLRSSSSDDKFKLEENIDLDVPVLPEVPVRTSYDEVVNYKDIMMKMGGNEDTFRSTDNHDRSVNKPELDSEPLDLSVLDGLGELMSECGSISI